MPAVHSATPGFGLGINLSEHFVNHVPYSNPHSLIWGHYTKREKLYAKATAFGDGWRKKERFRIRLQRVLQGAGYPNPRNFPLVPPATRNIMAFPNPLIFLYVKTTTFFAKDFRKTADIPVAGTSRKTPDMFSGKQVSPFSTGRERTCGQARPWPV
jgi:hypothetical protein